MVCNLINDLRVNDDLVESNQVVNVKTNRLLLVKYCEGALLMKGDIPQPEFYNQRILVTFLIQPMSQFINYVKG